MSLSTKRRDLLLATVQQVAATVYEAVPITEAWTIGAIHAELVRLGKSRDLNNTKWCLNRLAQAGLVKEPSRGIFMRESVREPKADITDEDMDYAAFDDELSKQPEQKETEVSEEKSAMTTMEKIDKVSAMLKGMADSIKSMALEVENLAIEVDDALKAKDAESEKLHQLKALLKSI